jgi:hypothetical protein
LSDVKSNTATAEFGVADEVLYINAPLAVNVTPVKDLSLKLHLATPAVIEVPALTSTPPPVTYCPVLSTSVLTPPPGLD